MTIKRIYPLVFMSALFISACTNDVDTCSKSEYINSVRVTVEDFIPENNTRTSYTVDNQGFHFQWSNGDALGIYPVGGDQVKFPISSGDGSSSAVFDGGAWKLRSEYQYAAYYPFSVDNYKVSETEIPVSYTGQTQRGNASTAHLGAYDYLACAATLPDGGGGVDLAMKHLGAFLRLQLTMPKADSYSKVEITSDGAGFVTTGRYNLTVATPTIKATSTSSTYTIDLVNVSTTEKNQVITVYAMVAPVNLSSSNLTITVYGRNNTKYVQKNIPGKNFVARSAYNIDVASFPSDTGASGEDAGWDFPSYGTTPVTYLFDNKADTYVLGSYAEATTYTIDGIEGFAVNYTGDDATCKMQIKLAADENIFFEYSNSSAKNNAFKSSPTYAQLDSRNNVINVPLKEGDILAIKFSARGSTGSTMSIYGSEPCIELYGTSAESLVSKSTDDIKIVKFKATKRGTAKIKEITGGARIYAISINEILY